LNSNQQLRLAFSRAEAANILGISTDSIDRLVARGFPARCATAGDSDYCGST
jgi:DNA-directed RNA polymerase specialized sigma24 family protein